MGKQACGGSIGVAAMNDAIWQLSRAQSRLDDATRSKLWVRQDVEFVLFATHPARTSEEIRRDRYEVNDAQRRLIRRENAIVRRTALRDRLQAEVRGLAHDGGAQASDA